MCPLAFSRLTCSQCHVLVSIKLNKPINVRVHCLMTISLSLISVQVKNVYIHLTQLYVLKINQPSTVYVITHVLALLKHTMQSMMCTMSSKCTIHSRTETGYPINCLWVFVHTNPLWEMHFRSSYLTVTWATLPSLASKSTQCLVFTFHNVMGNSFKNHHGNQKAVHHSASFPTAKRCYTCLARSTQVHMFFPAHLRT